MQNAVKVWDPFVRIFHWATALLFFANLLVIDEDSLVHAYVGYAVLGLVAARLVWGLIGTRHARFAAFRPRLWDIKNHLVGMLRGRQERHLSHNPLGALMVYNLLSALVLIGLTGVLVGDLGLKWLAGLHEFTANYAMFCVGLHVLGVLFERYRTGVDLVGAMITGTKVFPERPTR